MYVSKHNKSAYIDHTEHEIIARLIEGHSVLKYGDDILQLDNNVNLKVLPNDGCGGCPTGEAWLKKIRGTENVITRVEPVLVEDAGEKSGGDLKWTLFVFAGDERINLVEVEGFEDNGFYGEGFEFEVKLHHLPEDLRP